MKSLAVMISVLVIPAFFVRASAVEEKAFVDKYKNALEKNDSGEHAQSY